MAKFLIISNNNMQFKINLEENRKKIIIEICKNVQ